MQYQIYRKDDDQIIAWIDTDKQDALLHKDYQIQSGDNLMAREVETINDYKMTAKQYQEEAKRFNIPNIDELLDGIDKRGNLVCSLLGIAGESGEVIDLLKKYIFHATPLDTTHLKKEVGDLMWYITLLCNTMGLDLEEVFKANIDKLSKRYPHGFSIYDANHREEDDI